MHQYNIRDPLERVAIEVHPSDWLSKQILASCYRLMVKWLEPYTVPSHEASPLAEVLVTNFFCPLRVPEELHCPWH
jgi:hypothetical protein